MLLLNKIIYTWELIPIPVDSGGLQRTPFYELQSTLFVQSGGVYWIPLSGLHIHFSLQKSIVQWTPVDPSLWTTVNIYSSGVHQSPPDPPCDNLWHLDFKWVWWNPADHVGQCKVLGLVTKFIIWRTNDLLFMYREFCWPFLSSIWY